MHTPLAPYRVAAPVCPFAPVTAPPCVPEPPARLASPLAVRLFVAGVFTATAFGALIGVAIGWTAGAAGRWEIAAPAASRVILRPRPAPPPPAVPATAPSGPSPEPAVAAPPHDPVFDGAALGPLLVHLGTETQEPAELLARAETLQAGGLDLTIETRRLQAAVVERVSRELSDLHGPPIVPVSDGGRVTGVVLGGPAPLLRALGLERLDVVVSVNGVAVGDRRGLGPLPFGAPRILLLELMRQGEHRLVVYRW